MRQINCLSSSENNGEEMWKCTRECTMDLSHRPCSFRLGFGNNPWTSKGIQGANPSSQEWGEVTWSVVGVGSFSGWPLRSCGDGSQRYREHLGSVLSLLQPHIRYRWLQSLTVKEEQVWSLLLSWLWLRFLLFFKCTLDIVCSVHWVGGFWDRLAGYLIRRPVASDPIFLPLCISHVHYRVSTVQSFPNSLWCH